MRIYRTGVTLLLLVLAAAACSGEAGQLTVTGGEPAPLGAEDEIRRAFATFSNVNATQAERDAAVDGGTESAEIRRARWEQFKSQAAMASFVIDEIRFVSATEADVDFHVRYGDAPSPVVPNLVHGGAVLRDGHWRISKATVCFLASAVGNNCIL
ncbi:MAG: hypothetical protein ABI658_09670 [Acidimicrobiales bacterium]